MLLNNLDLHYPRSKEGCFVACEWDVDNDIPFQYSGMMLGRPGGRTGEFQTSFHQWQRTAREILLNLAELPLRNQAWSTGLKSVVINLGAGGGWVHKRKWLPRPTALRT